MTRPSASRDAKAAGLDSLAEVAQMIGKDADTLQRWHKENPVLFRAVILGCAGIKRAALASVTE